MTEEESFKKNVVIVKKLQLYGTIFGTIMNNIRIHLL